MSWMRCSAPSALTVPVTVSGNFRLGDIRHNVADMTRAREVLGFTRAWSSPRASSASSHGCRRSRSKRTGYERSLEEMAVRNLLK